MGARREGLINQLVHRYRNGHELVASSCSLSKDSLDLVDRLSDLSGSPDDESRVPSYLTGYPIERERLFAFARTWPDLTAPRSGCVVTHTLLVPIEYWEKCPAPFALGQLFSEPRDPSSVGEYSVPLSLAGESLAPQPVLPERDHQLDFVEKFFSDAAPPLVWFETERAEEICASAIGAAWPSLRRSLSFCTYALQPRLVAEREFDLMFAPSSASIRFRSVLAVSEPVTERIEKWQESWSRAIFQGASPPEALTSVREFLPPRREAVRLGYRLDELRRRGPEHPFAFIGAFDIVEQLATDAASATALKAAMFAEATLSARAIRDSRERLRYLRLLRERAERAAVAHSELGNETTIAMKAIASEAPEDFVAELLEATSPLSSAHDWSEGIRSLPGSAIANLIESADSTIVAELVESDPKIASHLTDGVGSDVDLARRLLKAGQRLAHPTTSRAFWMCVLEHLPIATLGALGKDIARNSELKLQVLLEILLRRDALADSRVRQVVLEMSRRSPGDLQEWVFRQRGSDPVALAGLLAETFENTSSGLNRALEESEGAPAISASLWALCLSQLVAELGSAATRNISPSQRRRLYELFLLKEVRGSASSTVALTRLVESATSVEDLRVITRLLDGQAPSLPETIRRRCFELAASLFMEGEEVAELVTTWAELGAEPSLVADRAIGRVVSARGGAAEWGRGWDLLMLVSRASSAAVPATILALTRLLANRPKVWPQAVSDTWSDILEVLSEKPVAIRLDAQALYFCLEHPRLPLGRVVATSFPRVYQSVLSGDTPNEIERYFGYMDWDRARELRRGIIAAFREGEWPLRFLPLAMPDDETLRKVCSRVYRGWRGTSLLEDVLADVRRAKTHERRAGAVKILERAIAGELSESWD